jgi:hypothetical protein
MLSHYLNKIDFIQEKIDVMTNTLDTELNTILIGQNVASNHKPISHDDAVRREWIYGNEACLTL